MALVKVTKASLDKYKLVENPGIFPAVVMKVGDPEISKTGKSNNYWIDVQLKGGAEGREIRFLVSDGFQPFIVKWFASCMNMSVDEFMNAPEVEFDPKNAVGSELAVEVIHDIYDGKPVNKAKDFFPMKEYNRMPNFGG